MKKLIMLLAMCFVLGGCSKGNKTLVDPNLSKEDVKEDTEVSTTEEAEDKDKEEKEEDSYSSTTEEKTEDKAEEEDNAKQVPINAKKLVEDFTQDLPKPAETIKTEPVHFGKYTNETYRSPKVDKIQSLFKERYDIDVIFAEDVLQYENGKIHYLGAKYYAKDRDDVRFKFSISKNKLLKFDFYVSGKEDNFKELKEVTNEVLKVMLGKDLASTFPQELEDDGNRNWKHDIDDTYYVMFSDENYSTIDLSANTGGLAIDSDISYEYFTKTDIKVDYDIQETLNELQLLPRVHNIKTIEELKKFLGSDTFKIVLKNKERDWNEYYDRKGIKMLGQVTDIYEHEGGVDITYYTRIDSLYDEATLFNDRGLKETLEDEMRRLLSKKLFPKAEVSGSGYFDTEGLTSIAYIDSGMFKYTVRLNEYYQVD